MTRPTRSKTTRKPRTKAPPKRRSRPSSDVRTDEGPGSRSRAKLDASSRSRSKSEAPSRSRSKSDAPPRSRSKSGERTRDEPESRTRSRSDAPSRSRSKAQDTSRSKPRARSKAPATDARSAPAKDGPAERDGQRDGHVPSTEPSKARRRDPVVLDNIVFGRHSVEAALGFQAETAKHLYTSEPDGEIAALARERLVRVTPEKKSGLDKRCGGLLHQGFVLETSGFPYANLEVALNEGVRLVLVLDGVEDPRNLGAAARAAHALGAELLVVPKDRAAGVTASAHKTAAGALFRIPVARVDNLRRALTTMKKAGLWIVGAEADGESPPWGPDLTEPTCLVVGGEDRGLRRLTREACDHVVNIPMTAPDVSLNAADAATVLLYEVLRQRTVAGS